MRFAALALAGLALLMGSKAQQSPSSLEPDVDFICPMDKDVHAKAPGKCPRCGMKLVAGIADPIEYPVLLDLDPRVPRPGKPLRMTFHIEDPKTHKTVDRFEVMHEKLFHLFLVSEDLQYFAHEHPVLEPGGTFRFEAVLPKAGAYRAVSDFYPTGGTPQMHVGTLYVAGAAAAKKALAPDTGRQRGATLEVELVTEPPQPLAGFKTLLFFTLKPTGSGLRPTGDRLHLEPYLGAWGHMLAASEDLIDMMHTHPFLADGGPKVQFNMIFPREGIYRVWVQFQDNGQVNTVAFNVPVKQLR